VLDAWEPRLARMVAAQAEAQAQAPGPGDLGGVLGTGAGAGDEDLGSLGELLGRFATTMGPVLLGMQFGSAAGHLAQRALGRYALPVPWPGPGELLVVPQNVQAFADDWSLPPDQARLWVCVRELTAHAVLSRPHVAGHVDRLLDAAASDMAAAQQDLTERMGSQAGDPESLQHLLADPESLLADLLTPGQQRASAELVAVTTAVAAYVDHVTAHVAGSLLGSASALTEAWYRYRTTDAAGERAAAALFGLDVGREQVDRGAAFVHGVVERAGEEGLARLWTSERTLPTPAELDAPGLWLERIDLPLDEGGALPEG
ncbi:MAG: zinc-dependent metalloprotease, partial [Acidimicrobiales bacterium]